MDQVYSLLIKYYDKLEKHFQPPRFSNNLIKKIDKTVKERKKFLDFGCGTGIYTELISGLFDQTYGIDICQEMIDYCNKKYTNNYICTSLENFDQDNFSLIISTSQVLNHIHSEQELNFIIQKFSKIISPDGILIFDIFNSDFKKYKKERRELDKNIFYTIDPFFNDDSLILNNVLYDHGQIKPYKLNYRLWKKEYISKILSENNFSILSISDISDFEEGYDSDTCKISFIARKNIE